jgi:predicted porin
MQKKIIALAVAGLVSGAAFAQSNVTIYGIVDAGFSSASGKVAQNVTGQPTTKSGRVNGIDSGLLSGSRIGFRGTEDLGGGLKAVFTLEYGLSVDDNTGVGVGALTTARQQYVGLAGGFGTVVAGRLQTPGYDWAVKYDANASSAFSVQHIMRSAAGGTLHAASRVNNGAAYISPSFSGLTVKAAYAFGEQDGVVNTTAPSVAGSSEDKTGVLALSADYEVGPLAAGLVYHRQSNIMSRTTAPSPLHNEDDQTEWGLAASYNFGMVTPYASYSRRSYDFANAPTLDTYKDKIWAVGVRVPAGNGSFYAQYARQTGDNQNRTTGANLAAGLTNASKGWGVGYTHSMSKRTTAYAGYARVAYDDGAQVRAASFGGLATLADEKYSRLVAGVRHSF